MANRRILLFCAGLFALVVVAAAGVHAQAASASKIAQFPADRYFASVSDKTNAEATERMRHASEKARAVEVAAAIADFEEAEQTAAEQTETESVYDEIRYPESGYETYTGYAPGTYDSDFRTQGVVYGDDGTRYTWYSQRILPGEGLSELNANGRAVSEDGFVVDADGYIAAASSDHPKGTVLDTPMGQAKVYDYCPIPGTCDLYTDF